MKLTYTKKLVLSAMCVAMCVVLPTVFHIIPDAGSILLPMHIPVLLCGMICGWPFGFACGLLGPLMSSLITNMPPVAILPSMMIECAVYGAASGLLMQLLQKKPLAVQLYGSLIPAMLLGRILSGIAKALIFNPGMSFSMWVTASFVTALPGILAQLIVLPLLIASLTRAHVLPRYSMAKK